MSGLGRFEETVSSLVYRFPPAGDARPAKRRRVEVPAIRSGTGDSAEVAGEAAGGDDASGPDVEAQPAPIETQASAALALAYDSPFAAVLSPDALVPTQGTSLRRPSATAIKSAVEIKSSGHPVLEWVGIYEPQGAAEGHVLGSPNDAAPEVILPELASVEDGQQIGCIDVTVKWAMEDADLLLIDEDGGDMEQAAAEAETRDLFNQIRQIVGNGTGTRFAPLISFRSEVFRRQDSEALTELPILLCRLAADRGDAPTLFGKPLVHPDVRLSTTGRYDRGLPMSVVAGNVSIPTGHGKRHRPSSTLLDAVYSLAKQRDPILFTHNAIVTAKYSSSDDCVSFHLKLPLYLHKDVLASIVEDRGSGRGTFWPLVHDLLNHLHPATSVLTKDGKLLAREPRLEDLGGEIRDLYSALLPDKDREDKLAAKFCQPAKLDCTLLPFQRRTVQWMLGREGVISTEHDLEPWKPDDQDVVRISSGGFWEKMQVSEGKDGVLWIERMTGAIRRDSDMEVEDRSNGGYGILAEEVREVCGFGRLNWLILRILSSDGSRQNCRSSFAGLVAQAWPAFATSSSPSALYLRDKCRWIFAGLVNSVL